MELSHTLLLFMGMLLLAMLMEPLAARLRLPFSALLVMAGFVGVWALTRMGVDTGLRWDNFHDLVFYLLLPVLIFEAAFQMSARELLRSLPTILFLAIPILLLSAALTAAILFYSIGHPIGFPWIAALITGVLLSATDPAAVLALFRQLGVPQRLVITMEGESLLNDATTIVLFTLLVALAVGEMQQQGIGAIGLEFVRLFLGGLAVGTVVGLFCSLLLRLLPAPPYPAIITLMAAYVSYLAAEFLLHVSGVMAALACGLVAGAWLRHTRAADQAQVQGLWQVLSWIANSSMFLLAGATVTLAMFQERWLAMLLGVAAILISRWLGIWLANLTVARLPGQPAIPRAHQQVLVWGGLRGAVTLALALSLPTQLESWWTIQSIAYGVVLFTLFVQAPTLQPLIQGLRRRRQL